MELKQDKWTEILKDINNNQPTIITHIYKRTEITLSHILDILKEMEELKLISRKTIGRTTEIKITNSGIELVKLSNKIDELLRKMKK